MTVQTNHMHGPGRDSQIYLILHMPLDLMGRVICLSSRLDPLLSDGH